MGALARGDREHLVCRNVEELGLWVDEVLDQPGAGDPVGLRSLACHPLHPATAPPCRRRPAAAATATSAGSGTLSLAWSSRASATRPNAADSAPAIVWRPITIAAPAIAPVAAAVAPLTRPAPAPSRAKPLTAESGSGARTAAPRGRGRPPPYQTAPKTPAAMKSQTISAPAIAVTAQTTPAIAQSSGSRQLVLRASFTAATATIA